MSAGAPNTPLSPTLKASVKDGVSHAVMLGAGESYLSAFGIFLRATPLQIGLLAALPVLLGSLCQVLGVKLMDRLKRRRDIVQTSALFQALLWVPIAALPFIFGSEGQAVFSLIVLVLTYHALAGLGAPAWSSLIGDLVPPKIRGYFFALRSKSCGILTCIATAFAGGVLELSNRYNEPALGFAFLFGVAAIARLISVYWLKRYDDPGYQIQPEHKFSFLSFVLRSPRSNFARFVYFTACVNFAVHFAGPFFSFYMLKELKLSYIDFSIITSASVLAQFLTLQHWGGLTDRFGTRRILSVCAVGISINPIMWLYSPSPWFLLMVQLYGGFVWAGYNLAVNNFMFDAVTPQKRGRCAAYQALVNGVAICLGSICGGYVVTNHADVLTSINNFPASTSPLLSIFLLSGLIRFIAVLVFLRLVREVREVEKVATRELIFRIAHVRPIVGATFALINPRSRKSAPRNGTSEKP